MLWRTYINSKNWYLLNIYLFVYKALCIKILFKLKLDTTVDLYFK